MSSRFALLFSCVLAACSAPGTGLPPPGGGTDAGTDTPPPSSGGEPCDGVDNNGDGLVDEGCPCDMEGAAQPCWPGPVLRRGVGACHDGFQYCERYGEFLAWGGCGGARLPAGEETGNCVDEDCDGEAPGCAMSCAEFESCGPDGIDDDCNGYTDCEDPYCRGTSACMDMCTPSEFGEQCTDGLDNDCDGIVDCGDADCSSHPSCRPPDTPPPPPGCRAEFPFIVELACGDGRDNDCDGNVDCADPDCRRPGSCGCATRETMCADGVDEDCEGGTDCSDIDCQRCTPGSFRWCDDPMYCHWGQQTCNSDGTWGTCVETTERPGSCSSTLYSATCCVDAGGCCQNYPTDDTSIGMCASIVTCR